MATAGLTVAGSASSPRVFYETFDRSDASVQASERPDASIRWRAGSGERPGGSSTVRIVEGVGVDGTSGLAWDYDFTGVDPQPGVYQRCRPDFPLPGVPERLVFQLLDNGSGLPLHLRLSDATGRVWQQRISRLDTEGWKTVEVMLDRPRGFSWGGKGGDKEAFVHPIRLVEFILEPVAGLSEARRKGRIVIDEVEVYAVLPLEESVTLQVGADENNHLTTEASMDMHFTSRNVLDEARALTGRLVVSCLNGESVHEAVTSFTLPPNGEHVATFTIPLPTRGYVACAYAVSDDQGRSLTSIQTSAGRIAPINTDVERDGFFGVCVHGASKQALEGIRRLGATHVRNGVQVIWPRVQPTADGDFVFERADGQAELHAEMGLHVMLEGGKNPRWLELASGEGTDLTRYLAYIRAVARQFSGRGYRYEFWNEPDLSAWPGSPAAFGVLAEQACAVIKEEDPSSIVLFASTSGVDFHSGLENFTLPALRAIDNRFPFDGLNVHPYCRPRGPDEMQVREKLLRLRDWMAAHAEGKPIWLGEIGWPTSTDFMGVSESLQAAYLAQIYIIGLSVDAAGVFWYKPTSSPDPHWHEMQYGYYRADGTPKPSALAFSQAAHRLDGLRFVRELQMAGAIRSYLFADENRAVATVYSPGRSDITLIAEHPMAVEVEDVDGRPLAAGAIRLGDLPVYWIVDAAQANRLGETLEGARLDGLGVPVAVRGRIRDRECVIVVANETNRSLAVDLVMDPPAGLLQAGTPLTADLRLDPMRTETLRLPLGVMDRIVQGIMRVSVSGQVFEVPVFTMPLHRHSEAEDARWTADPITLSREHLFPADMQLAWKGASDLSASLNWAWSPEGFHVRVSVIDDVHAPAPDARNLWRGDSIQLGIATPSEGADGRDVSEIGISCLPDGTAGIWCYSGRQPHAGEIVAEVRRDEDRGTTDYRVFIDWGFLGTFKPAPGKSFSASLQVNENDGGGRKSWLQLSEGVAGERLPDAYPVLLLQ